MNARGFEPWRRFAQLCGFLSLVELLRKARKNKSPGVRAKSLATTFTRDFPDATTDLLRATFAEDVAEVRAEVQSIISRDEHANHERLLLVISGLRDADKDVSPVTPQAPFERSP